MSLAALVAVTYSVTNCVARVVEARAAAASTMMEAVNLRK